MRVRKEKQVMWKERIRALRTKRGWTQQQLADALRVNYSTVSGWEGGKGDPLGPAQIVLEHLEAGAELEPAAGKGGAT